MDLPVCVFVATIKQKWHLRWECVIGPSRSPDVSMHADRRGIMRKGEDKKNIYGSAQPFFLGSTFTNLSSD